ncbi:hypothetical protein [Streptomyces salinarius]|uniref:hypothetical protein n=1 Tax=Streptomyces salinarius TaxID=2762598 RepID=UPI0028525627|nr:hypothetical protein [Streptomyces salinarius]
MTTDDSSLPSLPGAAESRNDFFAEEARRLASLWGGLPPEHFRVAVAAAKAEASLRSQERVLQMRLSHEAHVQSVHAEKEAREAEALATLEAAKHDAAVATAKLRHRRHVIDVSAGLTVCIALLVVAVLAIDVASWLSAVLCGPSLLALAKVFVLRRSDPDDMRILGRTSSPPPPP